MFWFKKSCTEKSWTPGKVHYTVETVIDAFNKELKIEEKVKKKTVAKTTSLKLN